MVKVSPYEFETHCSLLPISDFPSTCIIGSIQIRCRAEDHFVRAGAIPSGKSISPEKALFAVALIQRGFTLEFANTEIPIYPDSVFGTSSEYIRKTNQSIRLGLQRDIEFLDTDLFYGGIALGFGYVTKLGRFSNSSYVIDSTVNNQTYSHEISFSESIVFAKSLRTELAISFGLDVPLFKRFSINAEVGLSTNLQTSLNKTESPFLYQYLYASGGVRYSFGRRYGGTPGNPR